MKISMILSSVLYLIVGGIACIMAYKSLFCRSFLPFHEKAAGMKWNGITNGLQEVILTLLRITGAAFLISAIQLFSAATLQLTAGKSIVAIMLPVNALIFILALLIFNYRLSKSTKADTPWKGSIAAFALVAAGIVLSCIG